MDALVGHQGGWDEILMFAAPIVIAFFVIRRLERRGRQDAADQDQGSQNTVP